MKRKIFSEIYTPHFEERPTSCFRFIASFVLSVIAAWNIHLIVLFLGENIQAQFIRDAMDFNNIRQLETGIFEATEQIKLEALYFVIIATFAAFFSVWILKRQHDRFLREAKEALQKYPQLFNEWERIEGMSKPYPRIVCILLAILKILGIAIIAALLVLFTMRIGRQCFVAGSPDLGDYYFLIYDMDNTEGLIWGAEMSIFFLISLMFFMQLFKIRSSRKRVANVVAHLEAEEEKKKDAIG